MMKSVKNTKNCIKMLMQHIVLPFVYNLNRFKKIKEKQVVLADMHHDNCPYHMKKLKEELYDEGYNVVEFFFDIKSVSTINSFFKMIDFMTIYACSEAVFICDNFLPVASCRKREETKVIQIWHGSGAFKKFGHDAKDDIPKNYYGDVYKNYDMVTVSSSACVPYFAQAMYKSYEQIIPTGTSWTDFLFDKSDKNNIRHDFLRKYPDAIGKTIVLWAPTFRGNAGHASVCGRRYIQQLKKDEKIADTCYIIDSTHPHVKKNSMVAQELMIMADVLITDYSSVFFDYLLLDRPIIFFAPDIKIYSAQRGFYLDYKTLPGPIIGNEADKETCYHKLRIALIRSSKIAKGIKEDPYKVKRQWFKNKYMNSCDGKATKRIIEYINS